MIVSNGYFGLCVCKVSVIIGVCSKLVYQEPVSRKPRKLFRKANFSSSVSENGEVCTSETSCVKKTSVYIKNM